MTRYVGIDLAKRSMQVCAVQEESTVIERRGLKTDEKGRQMLCSFLGKEDVVAMEVCGYANTLARILQKQVGCEVHLLNPGALAMIWKSRKKTDKEDALKIAKYSLGHACGRVGGSAAVE